MTAPRGNESMRRVISATGRRLVSSDRGSSGASSARAAGGSLGRGVGSAGASVGSPGPDGSAVGAAPGTAAGDAPVGAAPVDPGAGVEGATATGGASTMTPDRSSLVAMK